MNSDARCRLALDLQIATSTRSLPPENFFAAAAAAALAGARTTAELTIRLVGRVESRRLNNRFRGSNKATNVLSFGADGLSGIAPDFLGDIVICAPLVRDEARAQEKSCDAHFAHLVVHGVLHLLGFDHVKVPDRKIMEERERAILSTLNIGDPYVVRGREWPVDHQVGNVGCAPVRR